MKAVLSHCTTLVSRAETRRFQHGSQEFGLAPPHPVTVRVERVVRPPVTARVPASVVPPPTQTSPPRVRVNRGVRKGQPQWEYGIQGQKQCLAGSTAVRGRVCHGGRRGQSQRSGRVVVCSLPAFPRGTYDILGSGRADFNLVRGGR